MIILAGYQDEKIIIINYFQKISRKKLKIKYFIKLQTLLAKFRLSNIHEMSINRGYYSKSGDKLRVQSESNYIEVADFVIMPHEHRNQLTERVKLKQLKNFHKTAS